MPEFRYTTFVYWLKENYFYKEYIYIHVTGKQMDACAELYHA